MQKCEWQGVETDCSALFHMVPTDSGMCCAFNKKHALKHSEYSDLVLKMQSEDEKLAGKYEFEKGKVRKVKTGKKRGLRMILDEHSNEASFSTVKNDFYGLSVFVGSPDEFPVMKDRSLFIQPGHENFIDVSAYVVKSSSDIKHFDPEDRNCYFEDEGNLEFHQTYSYSSCKFECSIKGVEKEVGCVPWYMPHGNKTNMCDPWKTLEFSQVIPILILLSIWSVLLGT